MATPIGEFFQKLRQQGQKPAKPEKQFTDLDQQRLDAAKAKRERRAIRNQQQPGEMRV